MGWSCSALANSRLDAISGFCVVQTGQQNVFRDYNNNWRFFEVSRREHPDGAITGSIRREDGTECGRLRIEGNGKMTTGPKRLKEVPAFLLTVDGNSTLWRQLGFTTGAFAALRETPTDDDLRLFIHGDYIKQFLAGGVNYHVSLAEGKVPYPTTATITDLDTGEVVATWKAAMFEAW